MSNHTVADEDEDDKNIVYTSQVVKLAPNLLNASAFERHADQTLRASVTIAVVCLVGFVSVFAGGRQVIFAWIPGNPLEFTEGAYHMLLVVSAIIAVANAGIAISVYRLKRAVISAMIPVDGKEVLKEHEDKKKKKRGAKEVTWKTPDPHKDD